MPAERSDSHQAGSRFLLDVPSTARSTSIVMDTRWDQAGNTVR